MKKAIYALLFLTLLSNSSLSAQTGVRFGLKGGYSMATQYGLDIPGIPYTVDSHYRHGMVGGILVYFPIAESFGIQQELLYVMKGARQDIRMTNAPINTHTEYNLNYLELPFIFHYTFVNRFNIGWNTLMMPTSASQAPAPLRNQDYIFTLGIYF